MAYIFWVEAFFLSGGMSDLRTSQVSATIGGCVVRARPRSTKPGSRWPMAQLAKAVLLNSKYDHLPSSPCVSNLYSFHSLLDIAKPDGRWAMQVKVLADLNLWRPQSLCQLFLGMGSKHQVISSRYHDHTWSKGQIGPGVCSCWSGYHMISPSVRSGYIPLVGWFSPKTWSATTSHSVWSGSPKNRHGLHVLCSQDAEEIDGNRHQVEIGQNKSTMFRNNLEILSLELGNSVLKYFFFQNLEKGKLGHLWKRVNPTSWQQTSSRNWTKQINYFQK